MKKNREKRMEPEKFDFNNMTPSQLRRYLKDKFVIVVSNRGPVEFRRDEDGEIKPYRGAGGIVTAMSTALLATDAVWISPARTAEDVEVTRASGGARLGMPADDPQYWVKFILPDPEQFRLYYDVISNSLLWFMQHYMWDIHNEPFIDQDIYHAWSEGYRKVNQLFAEEVAVEIEATDKKPLVFLQDYHLYLCARYIRERVPDALIHHFTHSPWVQSDYFQYLPTRMRRELLQGILSCDVVGFHTPRYAANFIQCCQDGDAAQVSVNMKKRSVAYEGRDVLVRSYPISIDHEALERTATREDVGVFRKKFVDLLDGRKMILRVDRIELSKNIIRGMEAYEIFLREFPGWKGKVTFVIVLYDSRQSLTAYRDYKAAIEVKAKRINEEFGEPGWQPLYLDIEDSYPRSVAALMEFDVLMVNPVSDGMNLVAKEGAVLNRKDGLILLSMKAGAYAEMKGSVLALDPLDVWETAQLLDKGLSMPALRKRLLAVQAREIVMENTSFKWLLRQIQNLRRVEKAKEEKAAPADTALKLPSWIRQI
jgi:trehalose 6-phosphate synthase